MDFVILRSTVTACEQQEVVFANVVLADYSPALIK
jgi:hypothetical protein